MTKLGFIYTLVAVIPIIIAIVLLYRSLTNKEIDSPVIFSGITKTVEEIMTEKGSPTKETTTIAKAIKVGQSEDNKAMGYSGQDKIAINSKDEAFIAYRQKGKGDYEIYVSKVKNGKLVSNKVATDSDDKTQRVPSITIDNNDVIHITWYGITSNSNEGRQIKYIRSTDDGKTWTKPVMPSLVDGYKDDDYWQEHPQILAKDNDLYIVWEGKDSQNTDQQIKFTKSNDGGKSWANWMNVKPSSENTQSRPFLVFDSNNNLNLFMYSSQESDNQQIWHSISKDKGETWSEWENVSKGLKDSRHATATEFGNKILLAWRSDVDNKSQLYFSVLSDDGWSEAQKVLESDSFQFFPVVGSNKNNEVAITWMENSDASEFPREDPQNSKGYFSKYNSDENKFENKILIGENIYYPHLITKNLFDNKFYIAYEQGENKNFIIKLLTEN
jgi:hypothetical protein